jgi:uncharacterized protein
MKARYLILSLLLAAGAGHAQTKKDLVAKVMVAQQAGIESVGRALAAQTAQRFAQAAAQGLQRVPADKREAVGRDMQAEVKKFHDEIEPLLRKRAVELAPSVVATAYEERFSEDELKQIATWLESPVSKKFAQLDRELGGALAEKVVADTRSSVEPRMKALEASLTKRLGLPAAGGGGASTPPKRP